MKQDAYPTALWLDESGIVEGQSQRTGITGGSLDGHTLRDMTITSETPCYGGIRIVGGEYTVDNLTVELDGSGGDDFGGKGTGLVCAGTAKVTVNNYTANNRGVIRNAVVVADQAEAVFRNANITCYGGTSEELEQAKREVRGLPHVPWVLGLTGNNRATNLLGRGKVRYIDSTIRAEGWGALSTDGPAAPERYGEYSITLETENCDVEVFGPSGYGSYAIGAGHNIFRNTRFRVPDYALIVANEFASADFLSKSQVDSRRFGVMWHQNQGGVLKIEDSTFHTGMATFLVKACYPRIEVTRSRLISDNGIILQLMDLDDPGIGKDSVDVDTSIAETVSNHCVSAPNYHDVVMFNRIKMQNYCTDLQASFSHMELSGDFYNGITGPASVGTVFEGDMPDMSAPPPENADIPQASGDFIPPMPEMKPSSLYPINLVLNFVDTRYTGALSATSTRHRTSHITPENNYELGMVENTLCPAVNNGVLASFDESSSWTVTKTCYLTALTLAPGAVVQPTSGKSLIMLINGTETDIQPGHYQGNIEMKLS